MNSTESFVSILSERKITAIDRHDFSWSFVFESVATLVTECPWRVLAAGGVALSNSDDGQQFGLPKPVDAQVAARRLLLDRTVQHVSVRDDTGDLAINFDEDLTLEVFNLSSGYEAWQLSIPQGATLVSPGGGKPRLA